VENAALQIASSADLHNRVAGLLAHVCASVLRRPHEDGDSAGTGGGRDDVAQHHNPSRSQQAYDQCHNGRRAKSCPPSARLGDQQVVMRTDSMRLRAAPA
jgi:hypothetical protein